MRCQAPPPGCPVRLSMLQLPEALVCLQQLWVLVRPAVVVGVMRLLACRPRSAGLCSEVPKCLRERILSFAGTSLIDNVNDQDKGVGELELHKEDRRGKAACLACLPLLPTLWLVMPSRSGTCLCALAALSLTQLHLPSLPCLCAQAATVMWTRPRVSRSRAAASCAPTRPSLQTPPPCPLPSPHFHPCPTVSGESGDGESGAGPLLTVGTVAMCVCSLLICRHVLPLVARQQQPQPPPTCIPPHPTLPKTQTPPALAAPSITAGLLAPRAGAGTCWTGSSLRAQTTRSLLR